jgi:hypothetical protein
MFKKKRLYFPLAALILAALACNMPGAGEQPGPNAAFTAAAQTVEVKLTEAALTQAAPGAITDTPAQAPTSTPGPTLSTAATSTTSAGTATGSSTCDRAQFVTDVTVADGTNFDANATFTKTWRIRNTGTCAWTPSYSLAFASGNSMSGPGSVSLAGNVDPGQTVDISVNMTAPASPGSYTGYWKLRNAAGTSFITLTVVIQVGGGGGIFSVNHVDFSVTGGCGNFHVTANVQTTQAGTVTYHWVWSDGSIDTASHAPLVFSAAGAQSVTTDWAVSASGSHWIDIYIDSPNHQQFGRATLTCP